MNTSKGGVKMKGYDKWLDKDNPTTNEQELSKEEIDGLKSDLQGDLENLMDDYNQLKTDDIIDVLKNFV